MECGAACTSAAGSPSAQREGQDAAEAQPAAEPAPAAGTPGLPADLDHSNEEVRGGLSDWLAWLQTCIGFHGMRLDFATGYAPEFTRE